MYSSSCVSAAGVDLDRCREAQAKRIRSHSSIGAGEFCFRAGIRPCATGEYELRVKGGQE